MGITVNPKPEATNKVNTFCHSSFQDVCLEKARIVLNSGKIGKWKGGKGYRVCGRVASGFRP